MQLCLFRHGDAGDRAEFAKTGQPDDLRPLSEDGREEVMLAAQGLHELLGSCDLLATSPLTRARQTAEIIAGAFSCGQV
ncbi:MAG TPA: phosphoglycerate mutase family protein, partial [Gemmatimonadaceae bacterium]|nr:phosphoglycerate mutase family protein [Gemmatimonadaceae bacterium]